MISHRLNIDWKRKIFRGRALADYDHPNSATSYLLAIACADEDGGHNHNPRNDITIR